ncbi:FAD-dependent oxidoreductase [Moorena sp. SIO4G3]|uniref:FAD-dependent oxidoreductase n=1 Tax=Moorena sp. SIO4G3 TaxID=2607821 RepID=UPI00142AE951|nr:FAD-dependent oxidoreductase [Moorena sp. SIO4G3]NEO80367.1 FAD-binding oxidoreductase [Moorena sp. SIO4G3]
MSQTEQILSQLPGDVLGRLRSADKVWKALRDGTTPIPEVITETEAGLGTLDLDVVICGGTLGILIGAALQQRGWRVAVVERGVLRGRDQEWNISRQELEVFLELELLSTAELENAIASEYNPARISFFQGPDFLVNDVLNIGVDPVFLLDTLKTKFLAAGGKLFEKTSFTKATIHPDGVSIGLKVNQLEVTQVKVRLLIDAMGHFSPIVKQVRQGQKPEGVCLVVGSCAQGYPKNDMGDLIVSFTPIQNQCQYFWEAFPARDGRTTYLFTYLDANPERPSLEFLCDEYFRLLPEYQGVDLSQLDFKRVLFGFFPSYQKSPLRMPWNRILPIGDSSGGQSPVSFGGFGSMVRHLKRLSNGINEALDYDLLDRNALAQLQPYQPNIGVTWMFQRTMSVGIKQQLAPNQINQLLTGVFQAMANLGDDVLKPFLQDVVKFSGLSKTLFVTSLTKPGLVVPVIPQVGLTMLLDWMVHYSNLALYSSLYPAGKLLSSMLNTLPPKPKYYYHRWLEAWRYGSGGDY